MKDCCAAIALIVLAGLIALAFVSCLDLAPRIQVPDPEPTPTVSPHTNLPAHFVKRDPKATWSV
jgi:hypothetical protein